MKQKISVLILAGCVLTGIATVQADENAVSSTNAANSIATATSADAISNHATSNQYTLSELTPDSYAKLDTTQQKNIAEMWLLTRDDYARYLWLMANTPNALYYKDRNLDPSWILGFEAKNEQERQKYVIIAIQNERVRIEKELAFQRNFTQLQQQFFPNQKPVNWTADEENAALLKPIPSKK